MRAAVVLAGSLAACAATAEPCCRGACAEGNVKLYGLGAANGTTRCRETCLGSMKEEVVRLYDRDLRLANGTATPCADLGYAVYEATSTSGIGPLKVTSDMYAPTAIHEFIRGVAAALGYQTFEGCFADTRQVVADLVEGRRDYKAGGSIDKAKAMVKLGEAAKEVVTTLETCSAAMTDAEEYAKLVRNLEDPRFYTMHNAFTLALNAAEDRNMIASLIEDLENGRDYEGGRMLVLTVLDVLERPGIPSSNGSVAVQVAVGIAEGFVGHIDIQCFSDAHVEIRSLVGGVMRVLTHVDVGGLESIFHALMHVVPTYKRCMADEPAIVNLLKVCRDFKHPRELAGDLEHNLLAHAGDVTIEATKAVLAFQGQEWRNLGEAVGFILNKLVIATPAVVV